MGFDAETVAMRFVDAFAKSKALLAGYVRVLLEARRRRAEHEEEFHRSFAAYCRARNLLAVCEDDWSTGLRSQERPSFIDRRLMHPTTNLKKETCHGQG